MSDSNQAEPGAEDHVRPDLKEGVLVDVPPPARANRPRMYAFLALGLLVAIGSVVLAGAAGLQSSGSAVFSSEIVKYLGSVTLRLPLAWVLLVSALLFSGSAIGYAHAGSPFAILINSQNRMSLSRYQMVLWGLVILPAFLVGCVFKSTYSLGAPLAGELGVLSAVDVKPELWILLGGALSAPLQSSSLLLSGDRGTRLDRREGPSQANFGDFFYGEDAASSNDIDLARVQQFVVSSVMAFLFGCYVLAWLAKLQGIGSDNASIVKAISLPTFDSTLLAIIAASHATYLVSKKNG